MRRALLINPPVYDTQYWERWSLPHGLLRVATYLRNNGYEIKLIDCLASDDKHPLRMKRREMVRVGTRDRWTPKPWTARLQSDQKVVYSFGKDVDELRLQLIREFDTLFASNPDEIWITSIMSYWWESTRDVVRLCKEVFPRAKIRVGGIYPTLAPEHAEQRLGLDNPLIVPGDRLSIRDKAQISRDLIVTGEIPAANDVELALDLYTDCDQCHRPKYTILTTSRGCPRDCEYCAAYVLSGRKVRSRDVGSVMTEIRGKYELGIREFCFYEDNLLMAKKNFKEVLTRIIEDKDLKGIELHSPEGLEIRLVDAELALLMRRAGFRRVYIPLETMDHRTIAQWGRDFYTLRDFERAVSVFQEAGFTKPQETNIFVLFGLPGEDLQHVYDTAIYAANLTGSVIPMLFAPVPGTPLFNKFGDYIAEMGFDLQHLNGKLLPFLEYNRRAMKGRYDLSHQDFYDVEAFMFRLNEKVRELTFRPGATSRVSTAFRTVFKNYKSVLDEPARTEYHPGAAGDSTPQNWITEYHGAAKRPVQLIRG